MHVPAFYTQDGASAIQTRIGHTIVLIGACAYKGGMKITALIVAAGRGTRAGGNFAKQWQDLNGRSVLETTLAVFQNHPKITSLQLVLHSDDLARAQHLQGVSINTGGTTRNESVCAGLEALAENYPPDLVLIHDVARPLVTNVLIDRVIAALENHKGAAPALAVSDALWLGDQGLVTGTQDRGGLYRAQTPQGFHFGAILDAHRTHKGQAADDVEVARGAGIDVAMVEGDEANLKITLPGDFARAAKLQDQNMDIRTGSGYDVHAFCPGDHVVLCGIKVPHDAALLGHSDADVAMHALTDAIYGALAEGDIGRHFPPSDPQWKGAASDIFLRHAVNLSRKKGFIISNIDVTIICEAPKIGPHADAMRARLGDIIELDLDRISVKATTSERLGFTGRKEGIAAMATITMLKS